MRRAWKYWHGYSISSASRACRYTWSAQSWMWNGVSGACLPAATTFIFTGRSRTPWRRWRRSTRTRLPKLIDSLPRKPASVITFVHRGRRRRKDCCRRASIPHYTSRKGIDHDEFPDVVVSRFAASSLQLPHGGPGFHGGGSGRIGRQSFSLSRCPVCSDAARGREQDAGSGAGGSGRFPEDRKSDV